MLLARLETKFWMSYKSDFGFCNTNGSCCQWVKHLEWITQLSLDKSGGSYDIVTNMMDNYYIHFQTNTLGKGTNPSYGLNCTPTDLLQGWLWH